MKPLASRPSKRLLAAAGLGVGFALLFELGPFVGWSFDFAPALRAGWVALAAAAFLDWRGIRSLDPPEPRRELPRSLSLHRWARVGLVFESLPRSLEGAVLFDAAPTGSETRGLPITLEPAAEGSQRVQYRFRPMARGDAEFGRTVIAAYSSLGLWRFTFECGAPSRVRVYPDFAGIGRFDANPTDTADAQAGPRRRPRRGEGTEFHQLREYRDGDQQRQVDWKATARRQALISREFEIERDQRVVFLLDCGRRMRARDGDLSHFDHALNAMVRLAHTALRSGDAVGMLSFGASQRWLPIRKGVATVSRLLNTVYDLETSTAASDFTTGAAELQRHVNRRSLVVVLTHLRAEDADDLLAGVELMRRRHLVLVANLRDEALDLELRQPVDDFAGALRSVGAWQYEIERRELRSRLRSRGVWSLDVTPSRLSPRLVEQYREIKRAGHL